MQDLMVRNILASMTDSLLVIGRQGEIIYANKATENILGCNLETLRADGFGVTFFTNEDNYEFNQLIVDTIQEKSLNRYSEVPYHHPDGSMRRLAVTMSYLVDGTKQEDSFVGFIAIFKDITEVFELRQSEKRLEEERQRVSSEKVQSLQKLAAGVAHEIRNPTVTIGGFAGRLLKLKGLPDQVFDYARKILDGAIRLESLVEQVQSYCDIAAPVLVETNVAEIIEKTISDLAGAARAKDIGIGFLNQTAEGSLGEFDPAMLQKAMVHLLENAIYFAPEGSLVQVVLTETSRETVIEVRDRGPGIRPADMEYIFNPFFSTRPDASGMGLATVQRIANEHMGTIAVESVSDRGACVRLRLPRRWYQP
jgi:PAS domain S-box-containing protein